MNNNVVFIILLILNSIIVLRMLRDKRVNKFLRILLGISYFGWNAVPLFLTSFTSFNRFVLQWNEGVYFFCNVVNQVYLFFVYNIAYLLIRRANPPKWCRAQDFQEQASFISLLTTLSICILLFSIIRLITSTVLYTDFDLEGITNDTEIGPYILFSSLSRFYLLAIVIFKKEFVNKRRKNLIILLLIVFYMLQTIHGGRICIFGILILFIYLYVENRSLTNAVYAVTFLVLAFILLPVIGELRQNGSRITAEEVVESSSSSSMEGIIREVVVKTNSVDYSSFLISSDGIGNAGIRVYTSQLYSLIPRFLYHNKPFGSSKDGTPMGMYARYAASRIVSNADETGFNVGTSTSLISLWTLGWPMYVFQIFLSGFFIWLLNCVFNSRKVIFISFMLFSINYPACLIDISLDIFIRDIQRWFVIYLFLRLIIPYNRYSVLNR